MQKIKNEKPNRPRGAGYYRQYLGFSMLQNPVQKREIATQSSQAMGYSATNKNLKKIIANGKDTIYKDTIYIKSLFASVPRILNQLDRNQSSPTYGCFDRDFWHYKTVDFPCARKQEAVLTLALLYIINCNINSKKNIYYQNENIKRWAIAGLEFWARIQHKNGSFDEWYPNEHSFVATAFSTYAITEALLLLKIIPSAVVKNAIKITSSFLKKNSEFRVQNQQTGAIVALYNIFLLFGDTDAKRICEYRVRQLKEYQDSEGWFNEYGGPDIGYLSLAIDYLAKYYAKSNDAIAKEIIVSASEFLRYFLHPDGSAGGVYASRNTEYLVPSGFESAFSKIAVQIAQFCRKSMERGILPTCETLDDRYLLYNGYTYAQAHLLHQSNIRLNKSNSINLINLNSIDSNLIDSSNLIDFSEFFSKKFTHYFKHCGLYVNNTSAYFIVLNVKKAGAFFFYSKKNNNAIQDSGIFLSANGDSYSNSFIGSTQSIDFFNTAEKSDAIEKKFTENEKPNRPRGAGYHRQYSGFSMGQNPAQKTEIATQSSQAMGYSATKKSNKSIIPINSTRILIQGTFQQLPSGILTPVKNIALRTFQLTIGKNNFIGRLLKEKLRDKVITPKGNLLLTFERTIILHEDYVEISDCLIGDKKYSAVIQSKQPVQYVPSARFFVKNDIDEKLILRELNEIAVKRLLK